MPLETVTLRITGANPQVKTIQVNVNGSSGTGSGQLLYTGNNGGIDAIVATATIAGKSYTSNTGSVAWQACPSTVSLGPVTWNGYANPGSHETWHGLGAIFEGPRTLNSVIFNQPVNNTPIIGIVSPDGRSGEWNQMVPCWANQVKPDGTALGGSGSAGTSLGFGSGDAVQVMTFQIIVKTAGVQTFYFFVDDAWAFYVGGGASRAGGSANSMVTQPNGSSPTSPATYNGLPLLGTRNTPAASLASQGVDTVYIKFPAPGIYSCVMWWVNNADSSGYFQPTFAAGQAAISTLTGSSQGSVMLPVAIQAAAPATTPSGNLQVSIAQGVTPQIAGGQTVNVTVNVTGIVYSTEPYIPLLEGTQGKLALYNSISSPTFTYPTYNSQPVDKAAAVSSGAINFSGDNTSWQGRLAPVFNDASDGNFSLKYNGNGFDSHVDLTHLVVNSDDVAWFDFTNKSFDLFTITSGAGGLQLGITVDYMVRTPVSGMTVTPSSVPADGGSHTFTLALPKPISPRQQGTQFGTGNTFGIFSVDVGGVPATTVTPILDAGGWLTGWSITATVVSSTTNGSINIHGSISGNLTYLNGSAFTTGTVTYAAFGALGNAVTTVGSTFVAPTNYSFAPPASFSGSITLTATVFAKDSGAMTLNFFRQLGSTNTLIGAGTRTNGPTAVTGGYTTTFTITATSAYAWGSGIHFGYTATDTLSGLAVTYFSSTSSANLNANPGGGGGGCPAVEMFIDDWHQVGDVFVGMGVETLAGEYTDYLTKIETEPRRVEWFDFSTELCYRFVTENGCEVIVSASTPVPTREAIEQLAEGRSESEVTIFASDVREGMHVITQTDLEKSGDRVEWSSLVTAECVGMRRVCRLYCGGRNFAAGVRPGKYIYTHNLICGK